MRRPGSISSPSELYDVLRQGVEAGNLFGLTPFRSDEGIVVATYGEQDIATILGSEGGTDERVVLRSCSMVSVAANGLLVVQRHHRQIQDGQNLVVCSSSCTKLSLSGPRTTGVDRPYEYTFQTECGPEALGEELYDAAGAFSGGDSHDAFRARQAKRNIDEVLTYMSSARPDQDVFDPQNAQARAGALEVITAGEHYVPDEISRQAIEQLR